jgi:hypothetical protein
VYFQYDMGTADTVSKTVDALLSDWAQIVHLYTVVEDLAEYFRIGECSYVVICTVAFLLHVQKNKMHSPLIITLLK